MDIPRMAKLRYGVEVEAGDFILLLALTRAYLAPAGVPTLRVVPEEQL